MDKKYSFANVTVRNYNRKFERKLSEEFMEIENQFANSKSQFYLYLASLGLEVHLKRKQKNKDVTKELIKENNELQEILNDLSDYLKTENEEVLIYLKVILVINSTILGVLSEIAEGNDIENEDIEHGLYDVIPERFLRILKQKGSK